ncbi:6665_t:CDS:2 [Ambispora gerdemannii]|uniref:6665_t:CDS:1 n=1 Tax=Ambispora gerdemannii TaxID=144530 RepID=A0A9N8Z6J8_9GLOM|nr:6665_t:CDS:2 [Ambispora gerdemannii]
MGILWYCLYSQSRIRIDVINGPDLASPSPLLVLCVFSSNEKRIVWEDEATKCLIEARRQTDQEFRANKRTKPIWEKVAAYLNLKGHLFTFHQCHVKWKNLLRDYRLTKQHNANSPNEHKEMQAGNGILALMDEFLEKDSSVTPYFEKGLPFQEFRADSKLASSPLAATLKRPASPEIKKEITESKIKADNTSPIANQGLWRLEDEPSPELGGSNLIIPPDGIASRQTIGSASPSPNPPSTSTSTIIHTPTNTPIHPNPSNSKPPRKRLAIAPTPLIFSSPAPSQMCVSIHTKKKSPYKSNLVVTKGMTFSDLLRHVFPDGPPNGKRFVTKTAIDDSGKEYLSDQPVESLVGAHGHADIWVNVEDDHVNYDELF